MAALILRRCVSATLGANGQLRPERVNTVDFEERPDGVCNVSIYRQADFRSLRSSGIWFEILERQESAFLRRSRPVAANDPLETN